MKGQAPSVAWWLWHTCLGDHAGLHIPAAAPSSVNGQLHAAWKHQEAPTQVLPSWAMLLARSAAGWDLSQISRGSMQLYIPFFQLPDALICVAVLIQKSVVVVTS